MRTVALLPGDGAGSIILKAAQQVLTTVGKRFNVDFDFITLDVGQKHHAKTGMALPETTITALRDLQKVNKDQILALYGTTEQGTFRDPIIQLRRLFNCYAQITPLQHTWIVRENTEGLYIQQEERKPHSAIAQRLITQQATERIAKKAFDIAKRRGNQSVTIVHKANILQATDGLFREVCEKVAVDLQIPKAGEEASVTYQDMLLEHCIHELIHKHPFDILLCPNLYGDVLSNMAMALSGPIHYTPSLHISDYMLLGQVHQSSHNDHPIGAIRAAALVCFQANMPELASAIEQAALDVIQQPCPPHLVVDTIIKKALQ